jgi:hypothetical protein
MEDTVEEVHPDDSSMNDMTELSNDCHQSLTASIDIIPSLSPMMNEADESQCSLISQDHLMSGDEAESAHNTLPSSVNKSVNCYCGKERDLNQVELQCGRCLKWFHFACITTPIGRCLKFTTCYTFLCKFCNPAGAENFSKRPTSKINNSTI